ncbi:hypothetical protein [Caulobacter phage Cr30]|uniref:hypothetical protein n=1 Tax=Caulobacter phage Cr30 TaxID=1357714 RepID=UPI0004A9B67B|nr:hypothetical protein OZ74_gp143 [Caulobacter phage Cr30]AGS81028.1 hypothetical protein [Caulobacter phage Cr30]
MEINIEISKLRERSIFLALPCYGGNTAAVFTKSFGELCSTMTAYGIPFKTHFLMNESLVQRARNYCADEFLRSDCSHMLFIDADIAFDANDVLTMLALMGDDSEYDIVGGPYAKKCITWEKIKLAVDKGHADEDPNELEKFVGDFVFNPIEGTTEIKLSEPAEVAELGTGFMMIKRKVFEKMIEAYPEKAYLPDHVRTANFDGSREIYAFFDCPIDPVSRRYLSEDYHFTQAARKIGLKCWLCPWFKIQHFGSYLFGIGGLEGQARLGSNPTAEPELLKNKK